MFEALPAGRYAVIYADPPWDYKGQVQHTGAGGPTSGGAVSHYSTVKLRDLKALDVASITEDDCLLFMWTTSPHLDQAIELMKSWGFAWATIAFVWMKDKVNPGFYTMSQCELCLVGKRGRIPRPRGARNVRQLVDAPRGIHSAKPHEVRERIDLMFPTQRKVELFARGQVAGWVSWPAQSNFTWVKEGSKCRARRCGSPRRAEDLLDELVLEGCGPQGSWRCGEGHSGWIWPFEVA